MLEEMRERERERGSGTAGPKSTDEGTHAVDKGIAWRGSGLRRIRGVRGRGRSWRRSGRGRGDGYSFHATLENECGPNANAAHQNNHPGIELGLDLGFGVVNQRRHKDLIVRVI